MSTITEKILNVGMSIFRRSLLKCLLKMLAQGQNDKDLGSVLLETDKN